MKKLALFIVSMVSFVTISAQVQVSPLPEPGFEQRIIDYINQMKVVDYSEDEAIKIAQMIFHDNAVRILNLKK